MNSILIDQNQPEMIRLLKAQSVAYDQAKTFQFVELWTQIFSLVTPIIGIFALPQTYERWAVLATAVFLIINGATFLRGKKKTDIAANIQEQFDIALFKLQWQALSKGDKIPIDDIVKLAKDCKRTDLTDWYSNEVTADISHSNAVLLCQDSNLIWDASLRKRFKKHFTLFTIVYYAIFIGYLIYVNKSFTESLLILFPTFSFLLFSIITLFNVADLIKEKKELSLEIKKLFEDFVLTLQDTDTTLLAEIQNRIYNTRKRPEKIPSWYHDIYRSDNQIDMDECVRAAKQKYNLGR